MYGFRLTTRVLRINAASAEKEQFSPRAAASFLQTQLNGKNIWGTDTVTLTPGELILKGRFGEFKHHRASTPMSPACLPMRQRGGVTT
jgi:hypothetical protein